MRGLGFWVWSFGFWVWVWGLGFGAWGLGFGVWGLGLGFGVWGAEFGVWGFGFEFGGLGTAVTSLTQKLLRLECGVCSVRCRVEGAWFGVWGLEGGKKLDLEFPGAERRFADLFLCLAFLYWC